MRKSAPPLLAIFRTRLQGELLARVYLGPPGAVVSISDLARELHEPVPTVHREVSRLVDAGLLVETKSGRTRLVSRPENDLVTRPLTELLAVTFGPLPVLTERLTDVAGVEEAYILRVLGSPLPSEAGPAPADVDVIASMSSFVGDADPDELDEVAEQPAGGFAVRSTSASVVTGGRAPKATRWPWFSKIATRAQLDPPMGAR